MYWTFSKDVFGFSIRISRNEFDSSRQLRLYFFKNCNIMTPAKFSADIKFKINEYIFPPPRRIFFIFSIRIWRETPACIKILSDIKFSYVEWFKDCSAPPETHISAIRKNFQRSCRGCNRLAAIWINLTAVPALFRCQMYYIKIGKFCKGNLIIRGV